MSESNITCNECGETGATLFCTNCLNNYHVNCTIGGSRSRTPNFASLRCRSCSRTTLVPALQGASLASEALGSASASSSSSSSAGSSTAPARSVRPVQRPQMSSGYGSGEAASSSSASLTTARGTDVRGVTSALSSFLREKGINARINRFQRRRDRFDEVGIPQNDIGAPANDHAAVHGEVAAVGTGDADSDPEPIELSEDDTEQTLHLRAPRAEPRLPHSNIIWLTDSETEDTPPPPKRATSRSSRSSKPAVTKRRATEKRLSVRRGRRRPADESDSSDSDSDDEILPSKRRVAICATCKTPFGNEVFYCLQCARAKRKAATPRKARGVKGPSQVDGTIMSGIVRRVRSLQDICITFICDRIHLVDDLVGLPEESLQAIADVVCRSRRLTDATAPVIMADYREAFRLIDCACLLPPTYLLLTERCPHLTYLELGNVGQMNDTALLGLAQLSELRDLALSGLILPRDASLARLIRSLPHLRRVALGDSGFLGREALAAIAEKGDQLTAVKLTCCTQVDDECVGLLSTLTGLLELSLKSCIRLTSAGIQAVFTEGFSPSLKSLDLSDCPELDDAALLAAASRCKGFVEIRLGNLPRLTDDGLNAFVEQVDDGLQLVDLSYDFQLTDASVRGLLHKNRATLTSVNLGGVGGVVDDGTVETLCECKQLTQADLSWVRVVDDTLIRLLLTSCPRLKRISIWGCNRVTEAFIIAHKSPVDLVGHESSC